MAFKMKNTSMAKLVKEAGNNRIINRMNKLQDKAEKANAQGRDKKAQRKIDKISKLEDRLMGTKRPEPTFEGTDEFRSKRKIKKAEKGNAAFKLKDEKGPGQGTKEGQYTGAGIPENLFNADGKKINTNNLDEGNLSKIKVESGTNRKYVSYVEGPKQGGRLYLSK